MPAALPVDWPELRRAAETGVPLRKVAESFGASFDAVRQRALREKWLIPSRVEALREQQRATRLSQSVTNPPENGAIPPATLATAEQVNAESLVSMGESLRHTVLQKTLAALRRADLASLPIDSWSDAKTAVEVGLKASGLEAAAGQGPSVNVLFSSPAPPVVEIDGHKSGPAPAPAIEDLL